MICGPLLLKTHKHMKELFFPRIRHVQTQCFHHILVAEIWIWLKWNKPRFFILKACLHSALLTSVHFCFWWRYLFYSLLQHCQAHVVMRLWSCCPVKFYCPLVARKGICDGGLCCGTWAPPAGVSPYSHLYEASRERFWWKPFFSPSSFLL